MSPARTCLETRFYATLASLIPLGCPDFTYFSLSFSLFHNTLGCLPSTSLITEIYWKVRSRIDASYAYKSCSPITTLYTRPLSPPSFPPSLSLSLSSLCHFSILFFHAFAASPFPPFVHVSLPVYAPQYCHSTCIDGLERERERENERAWPIEIGGVSVLFSGRLTHCTKQAATKQVSPHLTPTSVAVTGKCKSKVVGELDKLHLKWTEK